MDPFVLPEIPDIDSGELKILSGLMDTDYWRILCKLWDWQMARLTLNLYNTPDNHALFQGMVKGFASARKIVEEAAYVSSHPEPTPDRERTFYEKWSGY